MNENPKKKFDWDNTAKLNIHAGHRERVKENFLNAGLKGFQDHEALEMLLFFGIPQKNTNELAHLLMYKYGTLANVLNATYEDLMNVKGMTKNSAVLLNIMPQLFSRYVSIEKNVVKLNSHASLHDFFVPLYFGIRDEQFIVCCLNDSMELTYHRTLFTGGLASVEVSVRKVFEVAVNVNAKFVIISHNHPNGCAIPSYGDIQFTKCLMNLLEQMGVSVVDHVVVGKNNIVSMRNSGYLDI